ncbi:unnamed protein product [Triticum turgidum subsp. durum]|uniref:PRELI/MSF1 domain-containing protein n=1 Tax=Triticum turgidum subsp. durum TaxID=4567 RepID=A0A9R0YSL3_TRITD|nr:unnamed protein product [Triticum turgidum subsp. durum]
MVVYTQEHIYRHPWDRVTAAAWRKFTDPASRTALSHVADVHTLQRRVDTDAGRLHAARSITVRSPPLPFILRRLLPAAAKVKTRCAERFLQNSAKGREVVERICRYLEAEAAGAAPSAV